jgi:DNA-binding beta-propeller fold protein YncE
MLGAHRQARPVTRACVPNERISVRRLTIVSVALLLFTFGGRHFGDSGADPTICAVPSSPLSEARLLALERENGCLDEDGAVAPADNWPPGWDAATMAGGDVPPTRVVSDPFPTLHSVVVDSNHNKVFVSDPNRHALWSYERTAASKGREPVEALTSIRGPSTGMMFIAGVAIDSERQELYTVDNDIGDRLMTFPYDASGNVKPSRMLEVPHQAWGVSISPERDEVAVSVEGPRQIVIYKRGAQGHDQPLRTIRGVNTGLGDPHGVFLDGKNNEIVVANHGNQNGRQVAPGDAPARQRGARVAEELPIVGGRFDDPSITVYPADGKGNIRPLRTIQGKQTGLNWPMAIDVDRTRNEIAVANNGDSSIRIFRRTDAGDVAPVRIIKGALTGITGPMGVAYDLKNNELWVANYGDHTALVFPITAAGNVAPKRILRNAPAGSPTVGFGNPGAVAYDSKRDELLVPN